MISPIMNLLCRATSAIFLATTLGACAPGEGSSGDISNRSFNDYTERLALVGDYLYLLNDTRAKRYLLTGMDASSTHPQYSGEVPFDGRTFGIRANENQFVAAGTQGLVLYDASENTPRVVGKTSFGTGEHMASLKADRVYVASRDDNKIPQYLPSELRVLDLPASGNPSVLNTAILNNPRSMVEFDNGLLLCDGSGGLKYFRLQDKDNPAITDVVSPEIGSGYCQLINGDSAVYRLQSSGLDKIVWDGGNLIRAGRLEFGG